MDRPAVKIDAELLRQLDSANAAQPIEAVVTLRTPQGLKYLSAAQTSQTVKDLIAATASGTESCAVKTVFPNLQSFVVTGPAHVIKAITEHADVASAIANRQVESMLIQPVKTKTPKVNPESPQKTPRKNK